MQTNKNSRSRNKKPVPGRRHKSDAISRRAQSAQKIVEDLIPDSVEAHWIEALQKYLKEKYIPHAADAKWNEKDDLYFAKGVIRLNHLFTREAKDRPRNYFSDPVLRSGYLVYFLPVNALKTKQVLKSHLHFLENKNEIHLVDVGAGPMTLSTGVLLALLEMGWIKEHSNFFITVVEQSRAIAQEGETILRHWMKRKNIKCNVQVRIVADDVRNMRAKFPAADLILCGNLLTEMSDRDTQQTTISRLWKMFSDNNTRLFILEPGSKRISRDLQALRDQFLATTNAAVLAPCLHQKSCPLNLGAKADWCHFTSSWRAPALVLRLDRECGLKKSHLLYSYMIFADTPRETVSGQLFRAISHPLPARDKKEIIGCGPAGRVRSILWSRDVTVRNRDFTLVNRGDVFLVSRFPGDGFSTERTHVIGANESVKLL